MQLDEQLRGKMMADFNKVQAGDEQLKAELEQEKNECFTNADADQDGLLSKDEFYTWFDLITVKNDARYGGHHERTREELTQWFEAINQITEGVDGVSGADMDRYYNIISIKIAAEIFAKQAKPSD